MLANELKLLFEQGNYSSVVTELRPKFNARSIVCFGEEEALLLFLLVRALNHMGESKESVQVFQAVRQQLAPNQLKNYRIILPLLVAQMCINWRMGDLNELQRLLSEGDRVIRQLTSEEVADANYWIAQVKFFQGNYLHDKGEFDQALGCHQESLALFELLGEDYEVTSVLNRLGINYRDKGNLTTALEYFQMCLAKRRALGNQMDIARSLNNIGVVYRELGDLDKSLAYYSQNIPIFDSFEDKTPLATTYNNIAIIYNGKGDHLLALDYHRKALALRESIGNKRDIAASLNNLGVVYIERGELTEAFACQQASLRIREELGSDHDIAGSLTNIGQIHHERGEVEEALACLRRSVEMKLKVGNDISTALSLFFLLLVLLDHPTSNEQEVTGVVSQLEELDERNHNPMITTWMRLGKALYLKVQTDLAAKTTAKALLEQLVAERVSVSTLHALATLSLADLLLEELGRNNDTTVFLRITKLVDETFQTAYDRKKTPLAIQTLILRARLEFAGTDLSKALEYLEMGRSLAEQRSLPLLLAKVNEEVQNITQDFYRLQNTQKADQLQVVLKHAHVSSYLAKALAVVTTF